MRRPRSVVARHPWVGVVALAAIGALLLGCAPEVVPDPDIVVTGDLGGRPTLTYVAPLTVDSVYRHTVWAGTGPALVEGGPVLLRYWVEDARDARVVTENYSTSPVPRVLSLAELGEDLYGTLSGQHVGARLLQVTPPGEAADAGFTAVTVLDVLSTRATGTPVTPRADLPVVTLADDGSPTIAPTGTPAPSGLTVQPLLRGSGVQVEPTDVVTVQYVGFSWDDGASFDSTWARGVPVSFSLSDVPAWAEGLADQPVGSQVLLVVPPTYGLGATASAALAGKTVVFVIDILATGDEGVRR